jgi:hypothetical protein
MFHRCNIQGEGSAMMVPTWLVIIGAVALTAWAFSMALLVWLAIVYRLNQIGASDEMDSGV